MELSILELREYPDALGSVVEWIDREWGGFSGRTPDETEKQFAREFTGGTLPVSLVAINQGRPVGVATLRERDSYDWDPEKRPWVCNVYVCDTARGQGVAGSLCRALEVLAAGYGYEKIYLATTMSENSLYHRLGYAEYRRVKNGQQTFHLMQRDLPRPTD